MEFLNPNMKYVNITPENTQLYYTGINPTEECAAIKYNIIDYVYQRPLIYDKVKQGCITGTYSFIEMQSFADFIISL